MKSLRVLLTGLLSFAFIGVFAQEKTDSFTVYGNCGMCKSRIEKAAKMDWVTAATWDKTTKILTISFDSSKVTSEAVQKKVASVGHDTALYTAQGEVYDKLPGCCKYERKAVPSKN